MRGCDVGSGKTVVAELAVMRLLEAHKGEKAVYIGPLKSLVREKLLDWKDKFEGRTHHRVIELTGDSAPELGQLQRADIIVTTPEKWDGVSRMWEHRDYVKKVSLIIIDEITCWAPTAAPSSRSSSRVCASLRRSSRSTCV